MVACLCTEELASDHNPTTDEPPEPEHKRVADDGELDLPKATSRIVVQPGRRIGFDADGPV
jgi:hypothetical protein